ncbi:MAG: class II fructose-bisphosphate aldolase [Saccharofermentanales bacterium]|jgi:fructose-bisphosphate aldolase class II
MICNLVEVLEIAEKNNTAIGAFNVPGIHFVKAVISAAEELNQPVIIQHAQLHEEYMPLKFIGPVMLECARNAKVPVCVHLDHGVSIDYIHEALEMGFTSVMLDGSNLPLEENVALTAEAATLAKKYGASTEGEVGVVGQSTDDSLSENLYTKPSEALLFKDLTHVDALACSFGTVHGVYRKTPKLNFELVAELRKTVKLPLVVHGGSGLTDLDYAKLIDNGVRKINYFTYMSQAGSRAIFEHSQPKAGLEKALETASNAMRDNVVGAIKIFARI